MERKLATIDRITNIQPIENADFIEMVQVRNWQCVARKGEFQLGDLCVYAEIDSVFPDEPRWDFLKSKRIRTIKLRGQISQGIALPFSLFEETLPTEIGTDVSELLGITKFELPLPHFGLGNTKPKGNFPYFIPKTDEERVQNIPLHKIQGMEWFGFEKIDGTSATYFNYNGKKGICSRNLELKMGEAEDNNVYVKMNNKYSILDIIPDGFAVQGEIAGPGIQGNRKKLKELTFFMFHMFDINKQCYVDWYTEGMFYEFDRVPLINIFDTTGFINIKQYLDIAEGLGSNVEGIVFSRFDETKPFGKESFKIINNNYLLKNKE